MLWAVSYTQNLDPLGNRVLSTILAALPVIVLFYLLVFRRWVASLAGATGALVAIIVAWLAFKMPPAMAVMSFVHGVGFGLLPVGWTVFCAMLVYNVTVETGQFNIIRRSVASLSDDARVQAVLIGFAFGAFLEGAAGGGSPVAICGAMLVGLGFDPFRAAVICLIANTSPVAYGGLGTPILTLSGVTGLSGERLSTMAGHQLPLLSCLVPFYMVKCMCSWRQTFAVWPALAVGGGSFALFQFAFATMHDYVPALKLWPMTDIGGGIFSLIVTAIFLRFWRPKDRWRFRPAKPIEASPEVGAYADDEAARAQESVAALLGNSADADGTPLTALRVAKAWMPFALMSVFLMLTGLLRQREAEEKRGLEIAGPVKSYYSVEIPTLHNEVERAKRLQKNPNSSVPEAEAAVFDFKWLTSPGTPCFFAALLSMVFLRVTPRQAVRIFRKTIVQMKIPIPTIACMLGLSYVTRYAGMDATLGIAFAGTGALYPFFAAILGWLGVFLTGTDAGSNALFGSLQKITATEVYHQGAFADSGMAMIQAQTLICTANSTGGVMGKMIDAQSICVATAATHQLGREADIFKAVIWHSIFLASLVGALTLLQAYVFPFTRMVP
jgi:lactate permease